MAVRGLALLLNGARGLRGSCCSRSRSGAHVVSAHSEPSVSGGINISFLKNGTQIRFPPMRFSGNDSALSHLLRIPQEEAGCLVGQHSPPVSAFKADQDLLLMHKPDQPRSPKILKIAIIGAPNAGKSTLTNQLLGRKILPVSKKVHTTRCNAQGVITKEDTQLVLLDTPGLTTRVKAKRHNLEESLLHDPLESLKNADLVLVIVDVSDHYTRNNLHPRVLQCLSRFPHVPSVLVLNKVDLLKKKPLLLDLVTNLTEGIVNGKKVAVQSVLKFHSSTATSSRSKEGLSKSSVPKPRELEAPLGTQESLDSNSIAKDVSEGTEEQRESTRAKGWPHFQEIFMLAAVHGEEVATLKKYLLMQAKPGPWEFHSGVLTSQSPEEICNNTIREKLLEYMPEEVPYTVVQRTELWEEGPSGELIILQNLEVQKETHVKMLLGHRGQLISRIAYEASHDLMNAFLCDVRLKLCVKLKK